MHLGHRAGEGAGDHHRGLVGLDLHQRLILAHDIAGRNHHAHDLPFMHAFAEIGEFEVFGGHGRLNSPRRRRGRRDRGRTWLCLFLNNLDFPSNLYGRISRVHKLLQLLQIID